MFGSGYHPLPPFGSRNILFFFLRVDPVLCRVGCAVLCGAGCTTVRNTTGCDDAVEVGSTDGALASAEIQPADSPRAVRTDVGLGGRADAIQLSGVEVDVALGTTDDELGHLANVEEVVARKGQGRRQPVQHEVSIVVGERGRQVGAQQGRLAQVERDVLLVEGLGGQVVKGLDGEGLGALARVQGRDVVEHGHGAGGNWRGLGGLAGVVLEAEAEEDVLEGGAVDGLG